MATYKNLVIQGEVSVKPVSRCDQSVASSVLIIGPTGAGKSAFVEALCGGNSTLRIAADQLGGYTQDVTCYELVNASYGRHARHIHIIDTPGFSDPKISEMEIVTKLGKFIQTYRGTHYADWVHRVMYFVPITSTRLSGSMQRAMRTVQQILGYRQDQHIMIVTTFWDRLYTAEKMKEAEMKFQELRVGAWKCIAGPQRSGGMTEKFLNTQESALRILDRALINPAFEHGVNLTLEGSQSTKTCRELLCFKVWLPWDQTSLPTRISDNLIVDLENRVEQLSSQVHMLGMELKQATEIGDGELTPVVKEQLDEAQIDLQKFTQQLRELYSRLLPALKYSEKNITEYLRMTGQQEGTGRSERLEVTVARLRLKHETISVRLAALRAQEPSAFPRLNRALGNIKRQIGNKTPPTQS